MLVYADRTSFAKHDPITNREVKISRPDSGFVIENTIATLWAGVQAVPNLPKSTITKRSGRFSASKQSQLLFA